MDMMRNVHGLSPGTRIVLTAVVLVLVPSIVLGYLGFRSVSKRAESLRTNYNTTIVLVRDRLEAEVDRLESEVGGAARAFVADPRSLADRMAWLRAQATNREWLADPFFTLADGGVITSGLWSTSPRESAGPLLSNPRLAGLIRQAETAEFANGNLEQALSLYRQAQQTADSTAGRSLTLSRVGRTLFKLGRIREGISSYRDLLGIEADTMSASGVPYHVVALSRLSDGFDELGEPAQRDATQRVLLEYLVENPWDLQCGYGYYLSGTLDTLVDGAGSPSAVTGSGPSSQPTQSRAAVDELVSRASAILEAAATAEWIRSEIGSRLPAEIGPGEDGSLSHAHLPASDGEAPVQIRYRLLRPERSAEGISAFGYVIQPDYVSDDLLPRILESVDLGADLLVGIVDGRGERRSDAGRVPASGEVASAEFLSIFPGWSIALFDRRGRSIAQIVARENRGYGVLMVALVVVLAAGVIFTVRASAREAELARMKSDFVSNVSHELKTPLALIRMFGETLESGLVENEGDRQEFLAIIRRESERLTHLINNVLDFGKIESGAKEYVFAREDIVELVRETLDAYRCLFDRLRIEVHADLPEAPIYLSLDRDAIAQSLVNLFQNVIKYASGGEHVGAKVWVEDDEACVSVADRGAGIPEDELALIFEKYHRVEGGEAGAKRGSGLGLAIVKHAVEGHGGTVDVQSTIGQGSVFTLRLPCRES